MNCPTTDITSNYLKAILFPETSENARIPSRYPLESATFHKHFTIKSTVNASGNACLLFNPYYLYDIVGQTTLTSLIINNSATLNLVTAEVTNGYTPISLPFQLPVKTYSDYRLVSCSLKLIVNTPNLNATGIIGGGMVCLPGTTSTDKWGLGSSQFPLSGDLTIQANMDQSMYFKQADISKHEDFRIVYYPLDPSYEIFCDVNYTRIASSPAYSNELFCLYVSAAAASTPFTLELDYNFETLIYPTSKGFIPLGVTSESYDAGKAIRIIVSDENNITKTGATINQVVEKEESTFIDRLLNLGTSMGKLALQHLPELIAAI